MREGMMARPFHRKTETTHSFTIEKCMQLAKTKLPITSKVGTIEQGKFEGWAGTHGGYARPSTSSPTSWQSDKMLSGSFTFDDMLLNRSVCKTMMTKNKSLVEFKGRNSSAGPDLKKTLSRTSSQESFVDFRRYQKLLRERGSHDLFYNSFQKYLKPKPNNPQFRPEVISVWETDFVVRHCLGDDAPDFIIYKIKEFAQSIAVQAEVTWDEFSQALDKLHEAIEAEAKIKRDLPGLVMLMNKPRTEDKGLHALGELSSTYRDSFSPNTPLQFVEDRDDFYYSNHDEQMGENLNKAVKVLCAGTTKGTHQIPGYIGHIPANLRNPKKFDHAMGKEPHPVYNNLVLSQRGMGCVLGYTGHVPMEARDGQYHERKTSCDPKTSNGAAFSGTRTML